MTKRNILIEAHEVFPDGTKAPRLIGYFTERELKELIRRFDFEVRERLGFDKMTDSERDFVKAVLGAQINGRRPTLSELRTILGESFRPDHLLKSNPSLREMIDSPGGRGRKGGYLIREGYLETVIRYFAK